MLLQVHLPLYEPSTMLVLGLFSLPGAKRWTSSSRNPPQLLAKLRLRLSTITPNRCAAVSPAASSVDCAALY